MYKCKSFKYYVLVYCTVVMHMLCVQHVQGLTLITVSTCTLCSCMLVFACMSVFCILSLLGPILIDFPLPPRAGSWAASRSKSVRYTYIFQTLVSETGDRYAHILWCLSVQGKYNALGYIQINQQLPEWPNYLEQCFCTSIIC